MLVHRSRQPCDVAKEHGFHRIGEADRRKVCVTERTLHAGRARGTLAPVGDADEIERVEDAPARCGYRLTATWGPRRWRLGGSRPFFPTLPTDAYSPDEETLYFVVGRAIVELDRNGDQVRPPHLVPGRRPQISLAQNGRRATYATDDGAIVVLELDTMREVFRGEGRGPATLSTDGAIVAGHGVAYRIETGEKLAGATLPMPDHVRARSVRDRAVRPALIASLQWLPGLPAVVAKYDGDLRLWDVEAWKTDRVLDCANVFLPGQPRTKVQNATPSADGERVYVPHGSWVTALDRANGAVWHQQIDPGPTVPPGYGLASVRLDEDGTTLRISASWQIVIGQPDGTAEVEGCATTITLDARTGAILAQGDGAPTRPYALPNIYAVRGDAPHIAVHGQKLELDPWLGTAEFLSVAPDESRLLVATSGGLLLRLDRA